MLAVQLLADMKGGNVQPNASWLLSLTPCFIIVVFELDHGWSNQVPPLPNIHFWHNILVSCQLSQRKIEVPSPQQP